MPNIDISKVSEIIKEVAADKIAPRYLQLGDGHIKTKSGPTDLVTIADEEAEIELTRILKDFLPGSQVIGEEAVSNGKAVRQDLQRSDDYFWIVDPVDGTHNFAHGVPIFGTMVALVRKGERIASWIFQIPKDRMIAGEKGAGIRIDGASFQPPPKPSDDEDFKNMKAFISRMFMPPTIRPYVDQQVTKMADASTHRCCAWEYIELMEGERAFSVYKRIEPWDHMAGVLLLEEAGFYVRKWDGQPYGGSDLSGGLINAPSEILWERVYETFLKEPLRANPPPGFAVR
ncbi:MAG: inositol monophosphatase [Micavibrio aeruginosavorus]|uniref:Inositol monophosphatase n=1 Tax=Micavibrio aeruginosavorus TaxID=349221 RepID=A0A2W5PTF5_9BACT|nr:MAG: inositol monophosphatase [Micavibrio aeruginosavorus]